MGIFIYTKSKRTSKDARVGYSTHHLIRNAVAYHTKQFKPLDDGTIHAKHFQCVRETCDKSLFAWLVTEDCDGARLSYKNARACATRIEEWVSWATSQSSHPDDLLLRDLKPAKGKRKSLHQLFT